MRAIGHGGRTHQETGCMRARGAMTLRKGAQLCADEKRKKKQQPRRAVRVCVHDKHDEDTIISNDKYNEGDLCTTTRGGGGGIAKEQIGGRERSQRDKIEVRARARVASLYGKSY